MVIPMIDASMNISSRYGAVLDCSPASLIASGVAMSSSGGTVEAAAGDAAPQTPSSGERGERRDEGA